MNPALLDALGPAGGVVSNLFRRMGLAEEEIRIAKLANPGASAKIDAAFKTLCPSEPLRAKDDEVYVRHVRELLGRAVRGEPLGVPTSAELLCVALDSSLKAPLNAIGQALTERLFAEVFPEKVEKVLGKELAREPWPRAVDEELAVLRRKFWSDR